MGREEDRGGDSEVWKERKNKEIRKSERVYCEKGYEQNKIFFLRSKEYNIYKRREKTFFRKQPIENKPYFYKSFPFTKNSFLLINFFSFFYATKH